MIATLTSPTTPLGRLQARRRRLAAMEFERSGRDRLLQNAAHLPPVPRAIITAYHESGLPLHDLAALHGVSCRQMRRRLDRLRETLADPCFLLTVKYAAKLPGNLGELARGYWLDGRVLRELAELRGQTLHRIRCEVARARSLLLLCLAAEKRVSQAQAALTLDPLGGPCEG
jgi:hypothetical protein